MANEITITVRDRDLTNPQKTRQKWRDTQRQMASDSGQAGRRAGEQYGEGFKRGADGKMRDARGRFVSAGGGGADGGFGKEGEDSGRSWLSGLAKALGDGGGAKKIESAVAGMFTISAKTAATAFSAQFVGSVVAALASGAAKLAHGLASMAALLPAAALAGVTAMGTLKLAVVGVGDALEAAVTGSAEDFHKAVQGLSPSARRFALEVRHMRGELKDLQQSTQESFFKQFAGDTQKLGATYLPMVKSALTGVAASFGQAVHSSAKFLAMPETSGRLALSLGHVRAAVGNVAGALPNLLRGFLPLVEVGSTFLPKLTAGLGNAATKFADFMEHARDTGKLRDFIQGGLDKLKSLWETGQQVWRIFKNVVAVFQEFRGSQGIFSALGIETGGLLDNLEALSEKAKVFFSTASGGKAITEIFSVLQSLMSATFGTLARLAQIVGRVFAPIIPQMSKFAEATANFQLALADGLEPALQAVADALALILPPATTLLDLMSSNKTVMATLAGVIVGVYAAWKAGAVAAKIAQSNLNMSMAGAAGAAAGFAMALIQIDAARHAAQMEDWVEGMVAADGALTPATKAAIYLAQAMGGLDEHMSKLIENNPRVAQSIIDNHDAFGIGAEDAARYQDELDTTTAAIDNQVSALQRQKDALRAATDPLFAATDAQQRLAEAQARLTELQQSGTATAAELQQAHQDVVEAAGDNEAAMYDLGIAMEQGDSSLKAVLKSLQRQRDAGVITQETYNRLAFVAQAKFGQVKGAIESVPRSHTTNLWARDHATGKVGKLAEKLSQLPRSITVNIAANVASSLAGALGFYAHGGITGAAGGGPRNRMTWVGEHGPELVKLPPGSHVSSNPDSMRMASQTGGGGVARIVIELRGGDDLFMRWLRSRIQADGGNVQAVIGTR